VKQVFNTGAGVAVIEVPVPVCGDGEVLVQNRFSVISAGTESSSVSARGRGLREIVAEVISDPDLVKRALEMVRKEGLNRTVKAARGQDESKLVPLGYSSSGLVVEVGKHISDIGVGDRVACAGTGYACHAEMVAVPRNLVCRVPEAVTFEEAAYTTLGTVALQGVRRAQVQLGDRVVVIGLGLLGQLTCQILQAAGASVIGADLVKERVGLARELGLDAGIVSGDDLTAEVLGLTGDMGADAVIVCAATRSSDPVKQAMEMARKKGRVVVVGDVGLELDRAPFYRKELDFLISSSYGPGRYDTQYEEKGTDYPIGYVRWTENRNMQEFLDLLARKKVATGRLTDHVLPVDDAADAYGRFSTPEARPLGVLFRYDETLVGVGPTRRVELGAATTVSGQVRVAVIGAGSFAQGYHLPNLQRLPAFSIRAIATKTGSRARKLAEDYQAQYCTTDYREALADAEVDMVLVATRHNLHAPIAAETARAGKHVFVEKPLAMTYEQCREVYEAVTAGKVNLTVGFNRRFSPLAQQMKRAVEVRRGPLVITYRVNSAGMKKDHWINDPVEGGGAILGEGCHFFDFVAWLTGAEPRRIHAEAVSADDPTVVGTNNLVCNLSFTDGSVASVVYSTIGSASFPKERVEVFTDGKALAIDDFTDLVIAGASVETETRPKAGKGQFELLQEFGKVLQGESKGEDLPTVLDGIRATVCSLKALEAARSGKTLEFAYPW